ncbi:hypothetical protein PoB_005640200 [Plakobranchus ocellatus]|uniref:Uncharacterized protein n=1 Tax=Plakobranchus ocellatus TaxID=259542 RepID=A0AAV4CF86_9GAST|nr:hypothetical protein PoB_005640200 [Plakobranchus ocellatus]
MRQRVDAHKDFATSNGLANALFKEWNYVEDREMNPTNGKMYHQLRWSQSLLRFWIKGLDMEINLGPFDPEENCIFQRDMN